MAHPSGLDLRTLTEDPESWKGASFLSVSQITSQGLHLMFRVAQDMKRLVATKGGDQRLDKRVLATVFYEASTRTACSFQAAMMRLGGTYLHVDGHGNTSAGKKGETLEDTILCMQCYADVAVLRHPVQGSVGKAIAVSDKPIINAGDGIGEHPTQALLDVYTIYDELKLSLADKKPLTVVLLGDLKNGRTVHSLAKLLVTSDIWSGELVLRYCAPPGLSMPGYIQAYVAENCPDGANVHQELYTDLHKACDGADVLYVTRIQKERFDYPEEYEKVKGCYVVDKNLMNRAPSHMVVLHPLPRVDEICTTVDSDPRAAYFRQMENGMFVRMALLSLILNPQYHLENHHEELEGRAVLKHESDGVWRRDPNEALSLM